MPTFHIKKNPDKHPRSHKGSEIREIQFIRIYYIQKKLFDSNYFKSDIDFIVDRKTVELKTDTIIWRTNNLFIEDEKYFYDGGYYK